MNNINHQKQYSTTQRLQKHILTTNTHSPKHLHSCQCSLSIALKLKLINVSSQNQVLKKRLAQTEQSLQRAKKFEHIFNQSLKTMRKQPQRSSAESMIDQRAKNVQMPKTKTSQNSDQFSLTMKNSQECQNFISNVPLGRSQFFPKENRQQIDESETYKLDSYLYFKKLPSAQDKQTVKSLQFSLDSRSWQGSQTQLPLYSQEDFYSLREEYQQTIQNLEQLSQKKIKLLEQKINQLIQVNEQMSKSQKEERITKKQVLQIEQFEARQTAYFKVIQEQENQDSMSQNEIFQHQETHSLIHQFNSLESQSISSENWGDVAQQMRDLKATLEHTYEFLRKMSIQLKSVFILCKSLYCSSEQFKVIHLKEYLKLIESKKIQAITFKKCQLLQNQILELNKIISDLTLSRYDI